MTRLVCIGSLCCPPNLLTLATALVSAGRFDEPTARKYFQQLVYGVQYCHASGVVHRDLKPENLLVDEAGDLKISDFGLSSLHTSSQADAMLHTTCGTPNYVAPEVLGDNGYTGPEADVWSCGIILYVFLAGFLPFEDDNVNRLFEKIQNVEIKYPSWFSADAKSLLRSILVSDPKKRFTLAQVKEHPWFMVDNQNVLGVTELGADLQRMSMDDSAAAVAFGEVKEEILPVEKGKSSSVSSVISTIDSPSTPQALNAFDLINFSGSISRMFDFDKVRPFQPHMPKKYSRFTTDAKLSDVFDLLVETMQKLDVQCELFRDTAKIKGSIKFSKGTLHVVMQIFRMTESLHVVEFHRIRGDVFDFFRFYTLVYEQVKHVDTAWIRRSQSGPESADLDEQQKGAEEKKEEGDDDFDDNPRPPIRKGRRGSVVELGGAPLIAPSGPTLVPRSAH